MANLRRISSLDRSTTIHHVCCSMSNTEGSGNSSSSHNNSRLARHSSLPANLKFDSTQAKFLWRPLLKSYATEENHKASPKEKSSTSASDTSFCVQPTSSLINKEASGCFTANPTNSTQMDEEKSVVFTELRDSLWKLSAPSRSLAPVFHADKVVHMNEYLHANKHFNGPLDFPNSSKCHAQDRPLSLKMLRRKASRAKTLPLSALVSSNPIETNQKPTSQNFCSGSNVAHVEQTKHALVDMGDSISSALSSMVHMMRVLQQHAFELRAMAAAVSTRGSENANSAHADMLESFLWLFQHVFSRTPELMLLTMILLTDFTLHSMSKRVLNIPVVALGGPQLGEADQTMSMSGVDVPLAANSRSGSAIQKGSIKSTGRSHTSSKADGWATIYEGEVRPPVCRDADGHLDMVSDTCSSNHGGMNGINNSSPLKGKLMERTWAAEQRDNASPHINVRYPVKKHHKPPQVHDVLHLHEPSHMQKELPSSKIGAITLDNHQERIPIAPVKAPQLEADDYPCYDRTDLSYQQEISMDPANPLLLANYAQFLHVVRHDHGRAEGLYRKALQALKVEGEEDENLIGKFANFLWVAKGDVEEAEIHYKAAATADPSNAFHAGCYAHFLWSSSAGGHEAEDQNLC